MPRSLIVKLSRVVLLLLLIVNGMQAYAATCRETGQDALLLSTCVQELDPAGSEVSGLGLPLYPKGRWFRIDLETSGGERLLDLGMPDAYRVAVYLQQHGQLTTALALTPDSRFSDRPVRDNSLIAPLQLPAGATRVYVYYHAHARTPMFARLLTVAALIASNTVTNLLNGLIFGIMLLLIPILPLSFSSRRVHGLHLYGVMVLANILLVMQIEGYLFAFLWPDAPAWNMLATGAFAVLTLMANIIFAIHFLDMRARMLHLYHLHQIAFAVCLLSLLLHLLYTMDQLVIALTFSYVGIACLNAVQALRHSIVAARLYVYGVLSSILFPLTLSVFVLLKINPFPTVPVLAYLKLAYLCKTLLFGAGVISQLRQFNARQLAQRVQRLAESEQLLQAERAKLAALEAAREQQLRLASASHDMAQPLASLQFAIATLDQQHVPEPLNAHIHQTLRYAQSLLNDLLLQARQNQHAPEQIQLASVFADLGKTFDAAAREKGLDLSVQLSKVQLKGSALLLQRILNNLLANAVRYTGQGRIVLGARRRVNGVEIQVLDTGPGIPHAMQETILQAFQQIGRGEGYGLGLFIVHHLCQQCQYELRIQSHSGRGSCFAVFIPHHPGH